MRSSGSLVALERSSTPTTGAALSLYGDHFADYGAIWRTQPNVRTVVDFLARNVAQLGLHGYRRVSDTDRERLAGHPVSELIRRPNPFTTRYRLVYALMADRLIYDMALWVKFRSNEDPARVAVVRIPPWRVQPIEGSWLDPAGFQVSGGNGQITIPREACFYMHGYNPLDDRVGVSPMESLRRILAEEQAAGEYREAFWRNGARLEHVITRPQDAPVMSPQAKDRFWARWNAQYAGTANAAKTALLEEGMNITPMSSSAKDAEYVASRKLNLEEIVRYYHLQPQLVGVTDDANYSNMESAHKQLYRDALPPHLVEIEEELELQLLPDLPDTDDVYLEFNVAEKLKGSFEEQSRAMQTMVGGPVMTRNEGRARLNLPASDDVGADQLIVPLNVLVGGQASPTDSAPPAQVDETGVE